jgi:PIN domain nuclease of toxin-antitoxin system
VALLLDTHAFLWWLAGDRKLPRRVRDAIADPDEEVIVSAVSAWEITTKYRIGKLPGASAIVNDIAGEIASQSFTALPITVVHAQRAGLLVGDHRDPFDRMLIAQARSEDLILVSNEELFDAFGVTRLW